MIQALVWWPRPPRPGLLPASEPSSDGEEQQDSWKCRGKVILFGEECEMLLMSDGKGVEQVSWEEGSLVISAHGLTFCEPWTAGWEGVD
jgi:hypothetical protein